MKTEYLNHETANCWQCSHFAISWDTQRPYSCRIMGFKSRVLPCYEVFNADGRQCQCFQAKVLQKQLNAPISAEQTVNSSVPLVGKSKMNLWV
jgi:hypothetical protein